MQFKLRTLLLVLLLSPPTIWLAWKYEWIKAGYHHSDRYIVNNQPGYVLWLHVAWFGIEEIGVGDVNAKYTRVRTEAIIFTQHPYYHKKILLSY